MPKKPRQIVLLPRQDPWERDKRAVSELRKLETMTRRSPTYGTGLEFAIDKSADCNWTAAGDSHEHPLVIGPIGIGHPEADFVSHGVEWSSDHGILVDELVATDTTLLPAFSPTSERSDRVAPQRIVRLWPAAAAGAIAGGVVAAGMVLMAIALKDGGARPSLALATMVFLCGLVLLATLITALRSDD